MSKTLTSFIFFATMLNFLLLVFAFIVSSHADNSTCGISPSLERYAIYNSNKMFGGEDAKDGDWPWYALLSSGNMKCGSTIISDRWILTAAHCIEGSTASIRYGSVNRSGGEIAYSKRIFVHPGYIISGLKNDITLIKLNKTLTFSEKVQPICLDRKVQPYPNEILAQAGFGKDFIRFRHHDDIIYGTHNILQDGPIEYIGNSSDDKIRVGGVNHVALPNDSGGPLMAIRDNRWVQLGTASFTVFDEYKNESISIDAKNKYTKISPYCDWIAETTKKAVIC